MFGGNFECLASRDSEVALIQTFSFLGWGSALWHGSHTVLGAVVDNREEYTEK